MKADLDVRMKAYEAAETGRKLMPFLPIMARLDGRSFHSFCHGLQKPFDERFRDLMRETTKFLVKETNALMGYTQSDEISLVWLYDALESDPPFGGRVFKLVSWLSTLGTAKFNRLMPQYLPEKAEAMPTFDCRVWNVPNQDEAANAFLWREMDAVRSSILAVGQAHFSQRELHLKDVVAIQEMLRGKGVEWRDFPERLKWGTWVQRREVLRAFTTEELAKLPAKHKAHKDPGLMVTRHDVEERQMPDFRFVTNRAGVLFNGEAPKLEGV